MCPCVCVCMHVVFPDSRMQVALSESQGLDVHPEGKQIWGDDWYIGFVRLEIPASSAIS